MDINGSGIEELVKFLQISPPSSTNYCGQIHLRHNPYCCSHSYEQQKNMNLILSERTAILQEQSRILRKQLNDEKEKLRADMEEIYGIFGQRSEQVIRPCSQMKVPYQMRVSPQVKVPYQIKMPSQMKIYDQKFVSQQQGEQKQPHSGISDMLFPIIAQNEPLRNGSYPLISSPSSELFRDDTTELQQPECPYECEMIPSRQSFQYPGMFQECECSTDSIPPNVFHSAQDGSKNDLMLKADASSKFSIISKQNINTYKQQLLEMENMCGNEYLKVKRNLYTTLIPELKSTYDPWSESNIVANPQATNFNYNWGNDLTKNHTLKHEKSTPASGKLNTQTEIGFGSYDDKSKSYKKKFNKQPEAYYDADMSEEDDIGTITKSVHQPKGKQRTRSFKTISKNQDSVLRK